MKHCHSRTGFAIEDLRFENDFDITVLIEVRKRGHEAMPWGAQPYFLAFRVIGASATIVGANDDLIAGDAIDVARGNGHAGIEGGRVSGRGGPFFDDLAIHDGNGVQLSVGPINTIGERHEYDFRDIPFIDDAVARIIVELNDDRRHHDRVFEHWRFGVTPGIFEHGFELSRRRVIFAFGEARNRVIGTRFHSRSAFGRFWKAFAGSHDCAALA